MKQLLAWLSLFDSSCFGATRPERPQGPYHGDDLGFGDDEEDEDDDDDNDDDDGGDGDGRLGEDEEHEHRCK